MRIQRYLILFAMLWLLPITSHALVTTYTDQQTYVNALQALGHSLLTEGFENDAVWSSARSTSTPGVAASITSQGITWSSNNATSNIRTSPGSAYVGNWGFFSSPHGDYDARGMLVCATPNVCTDGFIARSSVIMYGIGGWFRATTPIAQMDYVLDGVATGFGDAPEGQLDGTYRFLGIIDTAGFTTAEMRETEGTYEDRKSIFADQFRIGLGQAPVNTTPVADAGIDQAEAINAIVTLDGTGSSDADGDPLSYNWSIISKPAGSAASLSNFAVAMPTFRVDLSGSYTIRLLVNDGSINSLPDTVTVSTGNVAPVADAGTDQSVTPGSLVTLDGSGSSDADGDLLSYSWAFLSRPVGSLASLTQSNTALPGFVADVTGSYAIQLLVTDGAETSLPDVVNVNAVAPALPIATITSPLANETVTVPVMIMGEATASAGVEAVLLGIRDQQRNLWWDGAGWGAWQLLSIPVMPAGGDPVNWHYNFDPTGSGGSGEYRVFTKARDLNAAVSLTSNQLTFFGIEDITINQPPVADAGLDQTVTDADANGSEAVVLDGSASMDSDGSIVNYSWSAGGIEIATGINPTVSLGVGTHTIVLSVTDNAGAIASDIVNVSVNDPAITLDVFIDSPLENTAFNLPGLITGRATAPAGVDVVLLGIRDAVQNLWWTGSGWGAWQLMPVTVTPAGGNTVDWNYLFEPAGSGSGQYRAYARARDLTGAVTTFSRQVFFTGVETPIGNQPPIADAGVDQSVAAGSIVVLDGSASNDADGDLLSYDWVITGKPAGSAASLSDRRIAMPTFLADIAGSYTIQLTVSDGLLVSTADIVTITALATNDPFVLIDSPLHNEAVILPLTIAGQAIAPAGVDAVLLAIKDQVNNLWWNGSGWGAWQLLTVPVIPAGGVNVSWQYDFNPAGTGGSGVYRLSVKPRDLTGYVPPTSKQLSFTVQ